jgi:hypothetical protein
MKKANSWYVSALVHIASINLGTDLRFGLLQDDTYTESYISTIGVDFVSSMSRYEVYYSEEAVGFSCFMLFHSMVVTLKQG